MTAAGETNQMHFAILNHDKPNSVDLRMKTRETHLDYLRAAGSRLMTAGPILADDGQTPIGSLLIVEAEDMKAARRFADDDPYARAGLFSSSTIWPWRLVFPEK
jgi:hypothetical protein